MDRTAELCCFALFLGTVWQTLEQPVTTAQRHDLRVQSAVTPFQSKHGRIQMCQRMGVTRESTYVNQL